MNLKTLLNDVEIKTTSWKSAENVREIMKAHNLKIKGINSNGVAVVVVDENGQEDEEEEDEGGEPDITVSIVRMKCNDEDNRGNLAKLVGTSREKSQHVKNDNRSNNCHIVGTQITRDQAEAEEANGSGHSNVDGPFECDLCGIEFRFRQSMAKHKRVVHGVGQFTCMFCQSSYPLKRNLLDHVASHRGPDGFRCNVCGKVRPTYLAMQRHAKVHAQRAPTALPWRELQEHAVQHSDLTFAYPSKVQEYLNRHLSEKRYRCDDCGKGYTSTTSLAMHKVKFHTDGREFRCPYCKEKCRSGTELAGHVAGHADERPFSCQHCVCRYKTKRELRRHQRRKNHSDKPAEEEVKQQQKTRRRTPPPLLPLSLTKPKVILQQQQSLLKLKMVKQQQRDLTKAKALEPEKVQQRQKVVQHQQQPVLTVPYVDMYHQAGNRGYENAELVDQEEDDEDNGWVMPEPEVCLRVVDSDSEMDLIHLDRT